MLESGVFKESTHFGMDKIKRYGWLSKNQPGELAYIRKDKLRIDQTYQRQLNNGKRLRIASNFNWAAFGVLICARRVDGGLWVIDGQHRHAAAMSRSDVADVPVIIFNLEGSIADEAIDFLVVNKDRRALTGVESFKSQIAAGDELAIAVDRMVSGTGHRISTGTDVNSIRCVAALYRCMTEDAAALQRLWPLVCELCRDTQIDQRLILGFHYLEIRLRGSDDEPRSLLESDNRKKLLGAGAAKVLRSIGDACAYHHRGGNTVFARGIMNLINYKRRNLFKMNGVDLE